MTGQPSIKLHIEPGRIMTWRGFMSRAGCRSHNAIALDGFVDDGYQFGWARTPRGSLVPVANFDHHTQVERMTTLATCEQVLRALRLGFGDVYADTNRSMQADVYINDCDQDICTAIWLLRHADFACDPPERLVHFVSTEGTLDATSGILPYHSRLSELERLNWVFEPYTEARRSGRLYFLNGEEYGSIIDEVCGRIDAFMAGKARRHGIDLRFDVLEDHGIWKLVHETGSQARIGMLHSGVHAFVTMTKVAEGRWKYGIGRTANFVPIDVVRLSNRLNKVEKLEQSKDRWGGSDLFIGSPRSAHSTIPPERLGVLIDKFILSKR